MLMLARKSLRAGICLVALTSVAWAAPDPIVLPPNDASGLFTAPKTPLPRSIWDVSPDGTATHLQSGMTCPRLSGDFVKIGEQIYDRAGFDISCGYSNPRTGVITLYLTRHDPAQLETDFEDAKKAIVSHTPSARPRDGIMALPAGLEWKSAGYDERNGALDSDIALTSLSGWEYEIRATYRPSEQAAIEAAIASLTGIIVESAGKHLAACAASPPPSRSGTAITDPKRLMTYSLIAAAGLSTSSPESAAPVWCAETAFGVRERPYVFWRNIAKAETGSVDRITPIGDGPPITIRFDALATAVANKDDPGARHAIYETVLEDSSRIVLAGIFDGRPSSELVAASILTRPSIQALAQINKQDHKISIFTQKP